MESALRALSGSGAIGAILAIAFGLLAGTIGVLDTAHAARPIYAANHTWRHRARIIHAAMRT